MSTDITLTSGMRANLYSLQTTQNLMERTSDRLATGKKVNSALDDPVNYFAAQGHLQRAGDLTTRKDEMSEAVQTVKAADTGIEGIQTLIQAAKSLAQSAKSAANSAEVDTLMTQFNGILDQIDDMSGDSNYKGVNLLGGSSETLTVSFDESGTSTLGLTGFDASTGTAGLTISDAGASDLNWADGATTAGLGSAGISAMESSISQLDTARDTLRTEAKELSSNLSIITARQEFTSKMINTLEDGAANLVNADMNEEGANMLMLQTRQQLATSSLSMASQAAQSVLRLF
jgi:flagellin-like hook-associated protein FlgL